MAKLHDILRRLWICVTLPGPRVIGNQMAELAKNVTPDFNHSFVTGRVAQCLMPCNIRGIEKS